MSRTKPVPLLGFLAALVAVLGGVGLAKGGFYVGNHEGDLLHAVEIVIHMAEGRWPHFDFMTPIGFLAFAPIVLLVDHGWSIGASFLGAQVLVAAALLPAIWWAVWTRLPGVWAYLLGLVMVALLLSLVHGGGNPAIAYSMHYNRWAWVIAFVAALLAVVPPLGGALQRTDGLVIGLAMAALALIKMTYFAGFALPIAVALVGHRRWTSLAVAIASGLAVAVAVTAIAGLGFWQAYLADLRVVAASEVRGRPGESLTGILGVAPDFLAGTLVLLAGVIFLRQAGRRIEGLTLLLLMQAFTLVTYQNWGNDPIWLAFVAILVLSLRPEAGVANSLGWDLRQAMTVTGAVALALILPTLANTVSSPFRHFGVDTSEYTPLLAGVEGHRDLMIRTERGYGTGVSVTVELPETLRSVMPANIEPPAPTVFQGETLPECESQLNTVAQPLAFATELERAGFAGARVLGADISASYWLYGEVEPPKGAAPWYYGGLPGFAAADYVLVPYCPAYGFARGAILRQLEASGATFDEVLRTGDFILYRPIR